MGYSLYEDNMAKGEIIFSKGTPFEWQKINRNTMNEKYLDIACKESGLSQLNSEKNFFLRDIVP